ncbi:hypothetical protein [Nocardia salmonicida]|uniref:hypothetical protein n=1 Tax=Nocardia salmonicida TaxID=53431 RepID=UPI0007A4A3C3|nr:hypothetical protein [Nocardia salmonicida]
MSAQRGSSAAHTCCRAGERQQKSQPPSYSRRLFISLASSGVTVTASAVTQAFSPENDPVAHLSGFTFVGSLMWLSAVLGVFAFRELPYLASAAMHYLGDRFRAWSHIHCCQACHSCHLAEVTSEDVEDVVEALNPKPRRPAAKKATPTKSAAKPRTPAKKVAAKKAAPRTPAAKKATPAKTAAKKTATTSRANK